MQQNILIIVGAIVITLFVRDAFILSIKRIIKEEKRTEELKRKDFFILFSVL